MSAKVFAGDVPSVGAPDVKKLKVDGKVGNNTWKAMHWYTVEAEDLKSVDADDGEEDEEGEEDTEELQESYSYQQELNRAGVRHLITSELFKI